MPAPQGPVKTNEVEFSKASPEAEEKPIHVMKEAPKPHSEVSLKPASGGIEVVATRAGFYKQRRLSKGDKFKVSKKEDFGAWMSCTDPEAEKQRVQYLSEKKKAGK